jgi:hypothetical protein
MKWDRDGSSWVRGPYRIAKTSLGARRLTGPELDLTFGRLSQAKFVAEQHDRERVLASLCDQPDCAALREYAAQWREQLTEARESNSRLSRARNEMEREVRAELLERYFTPQDLERMAKENDAWAQEYGQRIMASFAPLLIDDITDCLQEAAEALRKLIADSGGPTSGQLRQIESCFAPLLEELKVARMSVRNLEEEDR